MHAGVVHVESDDDSDRLPLRSRRNGSSDKDIARLEKLGIKQQYAAERRTQRGADVEVVDGHKARDKQSKPITLDEV